MTSPKVTMSAEDELDSLMKANVDTINRIEQAVHNNRTSADVVSDAIAGFCGSTLFVYVHCVLFAGWLLLNTLHFFPKTFRFDPPPFNMLTLVVSLEAIFLSTFVMIAQNRQASFAQAKADHDFVSQEKELMTNTELTKEIHRLTTELHSRLMTDGKK